MASDGDGNGTPPPAGVFSVLALAVTMVSMLYSCDGHRRSEANAQRMDAIEADCAAIKARRQEQDGRR